MEVMQKSLEGAIEKLDSMATQLTTVVAEVKNLRLQMEDFGTDLDGVKRRQIEAPKPLPEGTAAGATQVGAPSGATRLRCAFTNHGPPLLDDPLGPFTQLCDTCSAPPSPVRPRHSHYERQDYFIKPPKHDFPRFSGACPHVWLDMSLTYFEMYRVPSDQWISTSSLYMEGHAALWLQAFKRRHYLLHWDDFVAAVLDEFGQDEYDGQMNRLMQLKQSGSVTEHRSSFESCMYNLIALEPSPSTKWFVSQFVFGLRDDIRCAVRLQAPSSVTHAASLARIQEEELDHHRPRTRKAFVLLMAQTWVAVLRLPHL